jgi:hypothetical protein
VSGVGPSGSGSSRITTRRIAYVDGDSRADGRARAAVLREKGTDVLTLPSTALFRDGENWAVFVVQDGRAHLRRVGVGRADDTRSVIENGLESGDEVLLQPSDGGGAAFSGFRLAPYEHRHECANDDDGQDQPQEATDVHACHPAAHHPAAHHPAAHCSASHSHHVDERHEDENDCERSQRPDECASRHTYLHLAN